MSKYITPLSGWVALAAGLAGLAGILFIILFYTVAGRYGPLADLANGLLGLLSGLLAALLYARHPTQAPRLSLLGLLPALTGAVVVPVGSALVMSGRLGWYRAGLYTTVGFAGIGLWLLRQNLLARQAARWPRSLAIAGLVVGGLMSLGLFVIPGFFGHAVSWATSPWYLKVLGIAAGTLGWFVLYPLWCLYLGVTLLRQPPKPGF